VEGARFSPENFIHQRQNPIFYGDSNGSPKNRKEANTAYPTFEKSATLG
jgi:hypothetical protein